MIVGSTSGQGNGAELEQHLLTLGSENQEWKLDPRESRLNSPVTKRIANATQATAQSGRPLLS
jgi:hypothetical protein